MAKQSKLKIYLAGPMQGYKDFNFPSFFRAAKKLRKKGHYVFNPAQRDTEAHGNIFKSETGTIKDVKDKTFSLRDALCADTNFICLSADAIAMLPGWENSKGARAEHALSVALNHKIIYLK
jgi:hypothetical protein